MSVDFQFYNIKSYGDGGWQWLDDIINVFDTPGMYT